jgi:hypothetical protein
LMLFPCIQQKSLIASISWGVCLPVEVETPKIWGGRSDVVWA